MDAINRSALVGKQARLLGFGFLINEDRTFFQISLYRLAPDEHVLCLTQGTNADIPAARKGLGVLVPSELIAPFAQRHYEGKVDSTKLQEVLTSSYKDIEFEWYPEN